jgi:hypothetical protein
MLRRTAANGECVVEGHSMGAAIPDGASVQVHFDGASQAEAGAVVMLLLGGDTFSVHRLIARGHSRRAQGFILTHGDGNIFCDAPHRDEALLGTVSAFREAGRTQWNPIPPRQLRGLLQQTVTPTFEWVMCAALEVSPRLAMAVKNLLVLVMTPFFWLRPQQGERHRSSSRLSGFRSD